jgi:GNAT superfamily N-acetyltransferase
MNVPVVALRDMRQDEYDAYTAEREAQFIASIGGSVPLDVAREQAREGRERFLPDGLASAGHRLLVAENDAGEVVGQAWLGLAEPRTGSTETAWLYDIRVVQRHRRSGYARAILAVLEAQAREAGAIRIGLNVFGHNRAAVALYESSGYDVTTQQMAKPLR